MISKHLSLSIQNDYATGKYTIRELSKKYSVPSSTVHRVIRGTLGIVLPKEMTLGELRKQHQADAFRRLRKEYKLSAGTFIKKRKTLSSTTPSKLPRDYKCGPDRKPATLQYFQSLLTGEGDCLLYLKPAKIPRIRWEGQQLPVARIAAALHGLIPYSDLHTTYYKINSTCGNLRCCNPQHLRPQRVHPARQIRKSRRSKFILEHWQEEKP